MPNLTDIPGITQIWTSTKADPRINSDCWDVKLKFFDPENGSRARKVYLFTIDVSDRIPVTLGQVRSWSVRK